MRLRMRSSALAVSEVVEMSFSFPIGRSTLHIATALKEYSMIGPASRLKQLALRC